MYDIIQQVKIGNSTSNVALGAAGILGSTYRHPTLGADGTPATFRLVKFTNAITSPSGQVVVGALSAGLPTWNVATTTTQNNYLIAGVIPTMTTDIAANDYGWIQTDGVVGAINTDTNAVAGDPMGTATAVGRIQGTATATTLVATTAASVLNTRLGVLLKAATAVSAISYIRVDRLL